MKLASILREGDADIIHSSVAWAVLAHFHVSQSPTRDHGNSLSRTGTLTTLDA